MAHIIKGFSMNDTGMYVCESCDEEFFSLTKRKYCFKCRVGGNKSAPTPIDEWLIHEGVAFFMRLHYHVYVAAGGGCPHDLVIYNNRKTRDNHWRVIVREGRRSNNGKLRYKCRARGAYDVLLLVADEGKTMVMKDAQGRVLDLPEVA